MAKAKQPSGKMSNMIEVDAVEKLGELDNTGYPGSNAASSDGNGNHQPILENKKAGAVFVTALAALVMSIFALGFATFAVWQNSQQAGIATPHTSNTALSEATERRFALVEKMIAVNRAIPQRAPAVPADNAPNADNTSNVESLANALADTVPVDIENRFVALETALKDLVATNLSQMADEAQADAGSGISVDSKDEASRALGIASDQASLLIVSGLLADNMAGASLDRWIELLQNLADQGVVIPHLVQLRVAATPTPKRPLHLIKDAHDLVPQMTTALNQVADDAGFLEKIGAKLSQLVHLRKIGDGADRNDAALHAFEIALAIQDLDGAVLAAGKWTGPDVPLLTQWTAAAQSRQALDRAVSLLVTDHIASAIAMQ